MSVNIKCSLSACIDTHRGRGMPTTTLCWAISVPLPPHITGLYSLHCHTKNIPLIGLAPDHMRCNPFAPLPPRPCLCHQGTGARNASPCSKVTLPVSLLHPTDWDKSKQRAGGAMIPCATFHRDPSSSPTSWQHHPLWVCLWNMHMTDRNNCKA